jgi:hypothetical protein
VPVLPRRPAGRVLAGVTLLLWARPAVASPGLWGRWEPAAAVPLPVPDASPGRSPTASSRPIVKALHVMPGATCLSAETLAEHVPAWLGRDEIEANIDIEVRGDPFVANAAAITVTTPAGLIERAFDDGPPGCSDLHAVLGLAIAMAIDASVLSMLGYEVIDPPVAAPTPAPATDSERPPLQARRRPPEPPARLARLRAVAAFRGGLWVGLMPGLAGGGQMHAELGWRPWFELRLGVLGGYGQRRPLGTGTVEFGLAAGRLDACFGVQRKRLRPRLCVGGAAGASQALTRGLEPGQALVSPWVSAALALELRVVTTRVFAVDVSLDGVVPFYRPSIAVRDPIDASMIVDSVNSAPLGAVLAIGGAFTIR